MKWIAALFPSKEKPVPSSSTKICCKESIVIVYFIRSLTAYKGWFFFLVIISALGGLLELVFPLGVRDLLEEGVFLQSWPVLFRKIGFLALVEGAVFLFSLLGSYYGGKLSARVENDLRMTLFRHLTHLSFAFLITAGRENLWQPSWETSVKPVTL